MVTNAFEETVAPGFLHNSKEQRKSQKYTESSTLID